jgi:cell division protein FtsN
MKPLFNQRGGTILGFIVGLIVGLVIAVVVAMVVTKSAIPLSSKQAKQGKISEPTASQISDPNKPLYGSNAAIKEATKSFTKEGESSDEKGDGRKDATSQDKSAEKKKAESARAEAAKQSAARAETTKTEAAKAEAAKKEQSEDRWIYYLQTNAYREAADAESERAKLALTGFEARISEATSQGGPLYRVRIGPFSNIDTMNRVRGKLTDSGINAAVIRIQR